ncbi:MAG: DMT family transporter [Lysobacterales bacterium]
MPDDSRHATMLRAAVLMAVSAVLFGLMAVAIRLAAAELHAFEIAFFRNLFGLLFALPILLRHGPSIFRTNKLPLYLLRCLIGTAGMLCGFWALVNMPLAQAVAISYSTPLFVTIGAVLVLGEVVRARRWTAVLLGFVGVIILLHPGADSFHAGAFIALLAAAFSGSVAISIKFLTRTESPDSIVLYTTLIWVPMTLVPAVFVWQMPTGITWLWIAAAGFLGTSAHRLWTRALHSSDASAITPISFLQLPVVALAGWLLFDEAITRYTIIGSLIILASNVYIAHREMQLARHAITDPEIGRDSTISR